MPLEYFHFISGRKLMHELQAFAIDGGHDYRVQGDYFGGVEIKGLRETQEDRVSHFQFTEEQTKILALMNNKVREKFLTDLYATLNQVLKDKRVLDGSTGLTCLFDPKQKKIHFANLGDSELIRVTVNKATGDINLTKLNASHGLDDPSEIQRVRSEGHRLYRVDGYEGLRLETGQNLARSFADFSAVAYGMSHDPEIQSEDVAYDEDTEVFFIVACDGLTEINDEDDRVYRAIAQYVGLYHDTQTESELAKGLCELVFDPAKTYAADEDYSQDNISIMVTKFPKNEDAVPYQLSVFDGHGGAVTSSQLSKMMQYVFDYQLRKTCALDQRFDSHAVEMAFSAGMLTSYLANKLYLKQFSALGAGLASSVGLYRQILAQRKHSAEQAIAYYGEHQDVAAVDEQERAMLELGHKASKGWLPWVEANLSLDAWQGPQAAYHAGKQSEADSPLAAEFKSRLNLS